MKSSQRSVVWAVSWSEVLAGQYEILPEVGRLGVQQVRLEGEGGERGVEEGRGAWVEKEGDEVQVQVLVGQTEVVEDWVNERKVSRRKDRGGCVRPCLRVHTRLCSCHQL